MADVVEAGRPDRSPMRGPVAGIAAVALLVAGVVLASRASDSPRPKAVASPSSEPTTYLAPPLETRPVEPPTGLAVATGTASAGVDVVDVDTGRHRQIAVPEPPLVTAPMVRGTATGGWLVFWPPPCGRGGCPDEGPAYVVRDGRATFLTNAVNVATDPDGRAVWVEHPSGFERRAIDGGRLGRLARSRGGLVGATASGAVLVDDTTIVLLRNTTRTRRVLGHGYFLAAAGEYVAMVDHWEGGPCRVTVVDTRDGSVVSRVRLADHPVMTALAPNGRFLAATVGEEDQLVVLVDLAAPVPGPLPGIGAGEPSPDAMVWSPDSRFLVVKRGRELALWRFGWDHVEHAGELSDEAVGDIAVAYAARR